MAFNLRQLFFLVLLVSVVTWAATWMSPEFVFALTLVSGTVFLIINAVWIDRDCLLASLLGTFVGVAVSFGLLVLFDFPEMMILQISPYVIGLGLFLGAVIGFISVLVKQFAKRYVEQNSESIPEDSIK